MELKPKGHAQSDGRTAETPEELNGNSAKLSGIVKVPLASIRPSDSPRSAGENPEHIRALAESEAELPPIIVMPSTMQVIDGMHRLRATELRGGTEIDVRFFEGEEKDAFVLAVESNITHGLPLSLDDRKEAAARILLSHPMWSDRAIGATTGLSAKTVGAIRGRSTEGLPQSNVRIGRDGRTRPLDPTEGRRLAGRLMQQNPSAPLRQIAAEAGVSLSTVSDVRKRLQRGESPVPERGRSRAQPDTVTERTPRPHQQQDDTEADRPSHALMLRHLSRDPSVRLTEDGRALLRWLTIVAVRRQDWERLLRGVPPHRMEAVAELARGCARTWQQVAEQLERAHGVAAGPEAEGTSGAAPAGTEADDHTVGADLPGCASALESRRSGEVTVAVPGPPRRATPQHAEGCCGFASRASPRE
ncbi:ParB/RepB/Spo0J family partition protein [Streptomyces sparsogenes]|nr:ParB N-terminal domain-containing protein [Streptomyces sparsogenes]